MGFSQAPALPYSKLGIAEDGDTASRAISKGKYVIWKGKNYFAKTDILQGETFVVDTNLTEIPDGALNGIVDALNASIKHFQYLGTMQTQGNTVQIPDSYNNLYVILRDNSSARNYRVSHTIVLPKEFVDSITNMGTDPNANAIITMYYINGYNTITKQNSNTLWLYEMLSGYKFEVYVD